MFETILLCFVFSLFGIETLSRFGSWVFNTWRDFQDMKDATLYEDEPTP